MSTPHDGPLGDRMSPDAWQAMPSFNTPALKALRARLEKLVREPRGGRKLQFLPYLLVRTAAGDHGSRKPPLSIPCWNSPDIVVAPGAPGRTPAIPAQRAVQVDDGATYTVYAHVWNLGRAPLAGAKVEFYWADPGAGPVGANTAHPIGVARVDLPPRSSRSCHALVKCPVAWVPAIGAAGRVRLVVRASGVGDAIGTAHPWEPAYNRHVAARDLTNYAELGGTWEGGMVPAHPGPGIPNGPFLTRVVITQRGAVANVAVYSQVNNAFEATPRNTGGGTVAGASLSFTSIETWNTAANPYRAQNTWKLTLLPDQTLHVERSEKYLPPADAIYGPGTDWVADLHRT